MSPDDLGGGLPTASACASAAPGPAGAAAGRYRAARARTLRLATPLSPEDMTAQSMPDASPAKWHLAHTTWFFETFLLIPLTGVEPFDPAFGVLFNSYYEAVGPRTPRAARGAITRPGVEAVLAYRAHVDAGMERLLASPLDVQAQALLDLGLAHEAQHQELLLTDILHLLSQNPLDPAYAARTVARRPAEPVPTRWVDRPGGLVTVGADRDGDFAFDNERPRHAALLHPHRIAERLITNAEWLAFMEEGGYRRPDLWLSDGWARVREEGWEAPLYWRRHEDGVWRALGLHGLDPLDPHAPVLHVSHYEADAFARWRGARLPTEFEWEAAFADADVPAPAREGLDPLCAERRRGLQQGAGAAWQWTASAYLPYPGFVPAPGAVGEYNGKFMSGQMVLRGSSFVTAPGSVAPTYRNFFPPAARWQFTGVRLAADPAVPEAAGDFRSDVIAGLSKPRKTLPSKHLYDAEGSRLFEAITGLPEYYPTRTETALLTEAAPQIAKAVAQAGAARGVMVEFGSGSSVKTRLVLDALPALTAYAPIDISPDALGPAAQALRARYPRLLVTPVEGDFTRPTTLPPTLDGLPRIGFFPGSTIGNFTPEEAQAFLEAARGLLGSGALFLVGIDLAKEPAVLEAAYDDAAGVTAAFNLNLLARINRELDGDIDLSAFRHRAVWNAAESRVEMRLESLKDQVIRAAGGSFPLVRGETLHTENSYKHRREDFDALAALAGWDVAESWTAAEPHAYALVLLRAAA
jgi:dimethylhistidine N-methyltransferase